jgi:hypothetical protein
MTASEATAQGFHPLAGPFNAAEGKLRDAVVRDMKRGGIPYQLVDEIGGTSVWRKGWIEALNQTRSLAKGIRGVRD